MKNAAAMMLNARNIDVLRLLALVLRTKFLILGLSGSIGEANLLHLGPIVSVLIGLCPLRGSTLWLANLTHRQIFSNLTNQCSLLPIWCRSCVKQTKLNKNINKTKYSQLTVDHLGRRSMKNAARLR